MYLVRIFLIQVFEELKNLDPVFSAEIGACIIGFTIRKGKGVQQPSSLSRYLLLCTSFKKFSGR